MTTFATVLSVTTGRATSMRVRGETIVTGFGKRPTDQPEFVDVGGLTSDDHVDDAHDPDRAVLCCQQSHHELWSAQPGRSVAPRTFGEQLTIDGPVDDEVSIGDLLQIGDDGEIDDVIEPMDAVTTGKVAVCCAGPRTSVMLDL